MPALRAVTLAACALPLAHAQDLPDQTLTRDLEFASRRTVADAERIVAGLAELRSDLKLVAVISSLEHRGGCFADLDGDGDLDYVATEHGRGKESLRVHHQVEKGWRTGASRSRGISERNPLQPFVLKDDGSGRGAIVLPVARPPYLFLLPLNKGGDLTGKPVSLGEHLPRRLSRVRGVENVPYSITGVQDAQDGGAARIYGRMVDENARVRQDVEFELRLSDGSVVADVRQVAPGPRRLGLNQPLDFPRAPIACRHPSAERTSLIGTTLADANDDGIDDTVLFTGVLSAHVFPGRIENEVLRFEAELGVGRAVPIADLRYCFPVPLQTVGKEQRFATAARAALDERGFTIRSVGRFDSVFSIYTRQGKGWILNYYRTPDALVPVMDYRSAWPRTVGVHPLKERYREQVVLDVDHDRTPDLLSVHVGQAFEWLRPPPKERSQMSDRHLREVDIGRLRAGVVLGLGERGGDANRVLVQFDEQVKLSRQTRTRAPVSVTKVPVHGDVPGRVRYCVHFRPRRVGFFFEIAPVDAATAKARRFEAWRRRGERRLEMFRHYTACDEGECQPEEAHSLEVCGDAAALFQKAMPLAADARAKARLWRDVARCHSVAGEVAEARRAYERFVMLGKQVEPLDRPSDDLAALFADEAFQALHRGWSERVPVVTIDKL